MTTFRQEEYESFLMEGHKPATDVKVKGEILKRSWCFQSDLSQTNHGQNSKIRTVLKFSGSQLFKTVLTFDF